MGKIGQQPCKDAIWDRIFEKWVVPAVCPCCTKCWLYVDTTRPRDKWKCLYGGPFLGYLDLTHR